MARTLPRRTARALAPVVVPLVTKVALPIILESLRKRRPFDTDAYFEEASKSLKKGAKKSLPELEDVRDEIVERGGKLYEEARKQGQDLIELLAQRGSELAEEWLDGVRPRRRRSRWPYVLGILAVVGVGVALIARD
jgi:hypothetical protein